MELEAGAGALGVGVGGGEKEVLSDRLCGFRIRERYVSVSVIPPESGTPVDR